MILTETREANLTRLLSSRNARLLGVSYPTEVLDIMTSLTRVPVSGPAYPRRTACPIGNVCNSFPPQLARHSILRIPKRNEMRAAPENRLKVGAQKQADRE